MQGKVEKWFAWYPVIVNNNGDTVWLATVNRQLTNWEEDSAWVHFTTPTMPADRDVIYKKGTTLLAAVAMVALAIALVSVAVHVCEACTK